MKFPPRIIILPLFVLAGCEVTREIGDTITAPVRMFGGHNQPATQNAAVNSDVRNPGHPIVSPTPKPRVARTTSQTTVAKTTKGKATPSPGNATASVQFPVAKPVPGKTGLVYNPFNPHGAYIDVSGYAPGSKVKDPDSQKIFVVP